MYKTCQYITGDVLTEITIDYHIEDEVRCVVDKKYFDVYDRFERTDEFGVKGIQGSKYQDGYRFYYLPGQAAARVNALLKQKRVNAQTFKNIIDETVWSIEGGLKYKKCKKDFLEAKKKFSKGLRDLLEECGLEIENDSVSTDYGEYNYDVIYITNKNHTESVELIDILENFH